MSRLADILMGMDRGASRPEGVGGISALAAPETPPTKWRRRLLFVIVLAMLTVPVAVMLRSRSIAPPARREPVLFQASLPSVAVASPPATEELFRSLQGEGLEKAQQGALPEATGLFTKALDLRPSDAETWNSLGVVLVRQGHTARGVDAFRHALRLHPDHLEAHRNLAVTLDRQGRSGEAAVHYRAFLRLTTQDDPARDDVRRRLLEVSAIGSNPE